MAEAQGLLDELALMDLQRADQPSTFPWLPLPSLALEPLRELSDARQRNALRHWLMPLTRLPDSDHWAGWHALRDAKGDAQPCGGWPTVKCSVAVNASGGCPQHGRSFPTHR